MNHEPRTASLLVEGVAVTLFFAMVFVWIAIIDTGGIQWAAP